LTVNVLLGDPQNWFGPAEVVRTVVVSARPARDVRYNGRLQLDTPRHDILRTTERNMIWWALVASDVAVS